MHRIRGDLPVTDSVKRPRHPHPMQPIVRATDGVVRFQANAIVAFIVESLIGVPCHDAALITVDGRRLTYTDLMSMLWSDADRDHFNQLSGYSVSGLPWRSRKRQSEADAIADRVASKRRKAKP